MRYRDRERQREIEKERERDRERERQPYRQTYIHTENNIANVTLKGYKTHIKVNDDHRN